MNRREKRTILLYYIALGSAIAALAAGVYTKDFIFVSLPIILIAVLIQGAINFRDND